jgi:hypothetical protein
MSTTSRTPSRVAAAVVRRGPIRTGVSWCHTRFRKVNRMHPICAPGSSSAHIVDVTSEYPNNALTNKSIIVLYYMIDSLNLKRINKRR